MSQEYDALINLVATKPFLYDANHIRYKDLEMKRAAWSEIACQLGFDKAETAQSRWRNLRDTYVKYLRSQNSTTKLRQRIRKKWIWANKMMFLQPYLNMKSTLKSSRSPPTDYDDPNRTEIKEEMIVDWDETNNSRTANNNNYDDLDEDEYEPSFAAMPVSVETDESVDRPEPSSQLIPKPVPFGGDIFGKLDATDLLFLSYGQTLKMLPPRRQIETKMQIAQIMHQAELAAYDEDND